MPAKREIPFIYIYATDRDDFPLAAAAVTDDGVHQEHWLITVTVAKLVADTNSDTVAVLPSAQRLMDR